MLEGRGQGSYPGVLSPGDVLTGCWMTDCPGFKILAEEGSADVVERVRELELEVEAENVTKVLQSHDKA